MSQSPIEQGMDSDVKMKIMNFEELDKSQSPIEQGMDSDRGFPEPASLLVLQNKNSPCQPSLLIKIPPIPILAFT